VPATKSFTVVAPSAPNVFEPSVSLGAVKLNKKQGTATILVTTNDGGQVVIYGRGIRRASTKLSAAGTVKLPIRPNAKVLARLKKTGKATVTFRVTLTGLPVNGVGGLAVAKGSLTLRKPVVRRRHH